MKSFDATPEQEEEIRETSIPAEPEHIPSEKTQEDIEAGKAKIQAMNEIFPVEHLEPLRGLMYLGALEKEIEFGGHTFLIRTLREGEILRIGQLIKNYRGTLTEDEARKLYTVAACIVAVDGQPIVEAYKENYDAIYERANVVKQWYPAVIAAVYSEYIKIEYTAITVSNALKK